MYTQSQLSKIMSTSKTPQDSEQNTDKKVTSPQPDSLLGQDIAPESKILEVIDTDGDHKISEEIIKEKETDDEEAARSSRNKEIEENDDGFKTPTSPSHRIPSQVQCPPAPRKPLAKKWKRKATPPASCRMLQCVEPEDVESMFRALSDQENVEEKKTKKARRNEDD